MAYQMPNLAELIVEKVKESQLGVCRKFQVAFAASKSNDLTVQLDAY